MRKKRGIREWVDRGLMAIFILLALAALGWMFLVSAPTKNPNWVAGASRSVFSDLYLETWREWLDQYQSLIGGVLAVTAAGATVLQMRVTERKSDERHTQLIRLQTRADALRVDRMIYGNRNVLLIELGVLRGVARDFSTPRQSPVSDDEEFARLHRIETACSRALSAINNEEWRRARDLFQGRFLEIANGTITKLDRLRDIAVNFRGLPVEPVHVRLGARNEISIEVGRAVDRLAELIREIEKMEGLYFLNQ